MAAWNDAWFNGQPMPPHKFPQALLAVAQGIAEVWLYDARFRCMVEEWVFRRKPLKYWAAYFGADSTYAVGPTRGSNRSQFWCGCFIRNPTRPTRMKPRKELNRFVPGPSVNRAGRISDIKNLFELRMARSIVGRQGQPVMEGEMTSTQQVDQFTAGIIQKMLSGQHLDGKPKRHILASARVA